MRLGSKPGFSLPGAMGEGGERVTPTSQIFAYFPHQEKILQSRLPPPNFYSAPTKSQFPSHYMKSFKL